MVAVPDVVGVHWKTRSGARPEIPHVPASVLVPLVVAVKVPPPAGMTVALLHAEPGTVVLLAVLIVVEVVVVLVVVAVVAGRVVVVVVVVVVLGVAGRKVASTMNQLVGPPKVRLPSC